MAGQSYPVPRNLNITRDERDCPPLVIPSRSVSGRRGICCPRSSRCSRHVQISPTSKQRLLHRRRLRLRRAIGPRIGSRKIHFRLRIVQHRLTTSHSRRVFLLQIQLVSHGGEFFQHLGLDSRFNHDLAPAIRTHREPRVLQRRLHYSCRSPRRSKRIARAPAADSPRP